MDWIKDNFKLFLIASLSLGLAPFKPEPHIWGKIKWIAGGANGMTWLAWFDTFLHGLPWLLLLTSILLKITKS